MWKFTAIALAAALAATTNAQAFCTYETSTTSCALDGLEPSVDGSVLIYPGGSTRCAFDDYVDTSTGFVTNATFFFQVFPSLEETASGNKLMIFFRGGGACTDATTCNFATQCSLGTSQTFHTAAESFNEGMLNRTNPDNLFNDWDIVHIPYCTGDLDGGNKVYPGVDYSFLTAFGQPQCLGQGMSMHMNGYANSQSALQWALANYPNPKQLLISGTSAGSLSIQAYSALVADMWQVEERAIPYSVLSDSFVGVLPEDQPAGILLDYFGTCDLDMHWTNATVAACKEESLQMVDLVAANMKLVPEDSKWLFIDSKGDATQRKFYEIVKESIAGYPFTNLISEELFFGNMTAITDVYKNVSGQVSTFFVEGETHVFLNDNGFTTVVSADGAVLGEVLEAFVEPPTPTIAPTTTPVPSVTAEPVTPVPWWCVLLHKLHLPSGFCLSSN